MSGRIFQNVVLQFKDTTDRTVGVIDAEGTVIACSELTGIGKKWAKYVEAIDAAEGGCIALEGKTFKALPGWGGHFDYAVFATGDDSVGRTVCAMACVALNSAKTYYEEKHDKGSFIKNIISDNILISDIYMRAKELHVAAEVPRGVFVIRPVEGRSEGISLEVVQNLFPDRQNDFVISVGETDVALIHQMPESTTNKDLEKVATTIEEALREDGESRVFVGIGTLALHLRDLAKSYKEAQIAIEVGKVFDTERYVINYENLGIGRLIYQLPTTLCEMFLQEVFKKNPIDALDQETLFTSIGAAVVEDFYDENVVFLRFCFEKELLKKNPLDRQGRILRMVYLNQDLTKAGKYLFPRLMQKFLVFTDRNGKTSLETMLKRWYTQLEKEYRNQTAG